MNTNDHDAVKDNAAPSQENTTTFDAVLHHETASRRIVELSDEYYRLNENLLEANARVAAAKRNVISVKENKEGLAVDEHIRALSEARDEYLERCIEATIAIDRVTRNNDENNILTDYIRRLREEEKKHDAK